MGKHVRPENMTPNELVNYINDLTDRRSRTKDKDTRIKLSTLIQQAHAVKDGK